jgi:hypothetical protein
MYRRKPPDELNRAADTVPRSPSMLCMSGGYAIAALPSGRRTTCHPAGAGAAARRWIDGTFPGGPSEWLTAEDDEHPAAARATAARGTAARAAATTGTEVEAGALTRKRLDVAVTVTRTAAVVPVVVAAVVLRDPPTAAAAATTTAAAAAAA